MKDINWKILSKQMLINLPVFLFCVAFISLYKLFFGANNNIIGVILLIGLFMQIKGDLGFKAEHAALSIVFMFCIITVCPVIAAIHPVIGLFVNAGSILLIMILSSHDVAMSNHVSFMMGYLFCLGYPVSGHDYTLRAISLVGGGALIAFAYYLLNRKKEYKRTISDLFRELHFDSIRTRWYTQLTFLLSVTIFIFDLMHYPRTMWVSLTILSLTLPFQEDSSKRRKVRIQAAILGTALFYMVFEVIVPLEYQPAIVLLAGYFSMFIKDYFYKCIYNSFSALGTAVILFSTQGAIELRIVSNIIGTIIAFGGFYLFEFFFKQIDTQKAQKPLA